MTIFYPTSTINATRIRSSAIESAQGTLEEHIGVDYILDENGKLNEETRWLIYIDDRIAIERIRATYQYMQHADVLPIIGIFSNYYHNMVGYLGPLTILRQLKARPDNYSKARDLGVGWELKISYLIPGQVVRDSIFVTSGGRYPLLTTKIWGIYSQVARSVKDKDLFLNRIDHLFREDGKIWRVKF